MDSPGSRLRKGQGKREKDGEGEKGEGKERSYRLEPESQGTKLSSNR